MAVFSRYDTEVGHLCCWGEDGYAALVDRLAEVFEAELLDGCPVCLSRYLLQASFAVYVHAESGPESDAKTIVKGFSEAALDVALETREVLISPEKINALFNGT